MTPWQYKIAQDGFTAKSEREHDNAAWHMWHTAALSGIKKMPPLKSFLSTSLNKRKNPSQGIDEHAIISRLKAYQKRVSKE